MSETKNHHYVPKAYLKQFGFPRKFGQNTADDLSVWKQRIDIPSFSPKAIEIGNGLCEEDFFYRINTEHSFVGSSFGDNPNIIEDFGFPYETLLFNLFKKLKYNAPLTKFSISRKDMMDLSYAMIDIKWRNPWIRKKYNLEYLKELQNEFKKNLPQLKEDVIKHLNEIEEEVVSETFTYFMPKLLYDLDYKSAPELTKTIHSTAFYRDENIRNIYIKLITRFANSNWTIIQTDPNNQFITSDNPGIFLNKYHVQSFTTIDQIEQLKLDRFFFPLSGLHGLLIQLFVPDRISTLFEKKIDIIYLPQSVAEYNICHCVHVNKILIASNKQALKEAWKKGKDSWINK